MLTKGRITTHGKRADDWGIFLTSENVPHQGAVLVDDSGNSTGTANNPLFTRDFLIEVAEGNIPGHSIINKYGRNPNIPNAVGTFEAVWNGGGVYTGHNAVTAQTIEVFSGSGNDTGTVLSGDNATGGSSTTLIDGDATFSSNGVAAGDVIINDTQQDHGIVKTVTSETILTVRRFEGGTTPVSSDAYRVVTKASTGTPVLKLNKLLNANYAETSEYIVLKGLTKVDTTGTYLRSSRARCHGGTNVGEITARQKTTTANIFIVLPVGYNSTMIAADTIPAGKTGYFLEWFASLSGKTNANVNIRLRTAAVGDVSQVQEEFSIMGAGTSFSPRPFIIPKGGYPEMTDIVAEADSDANSTGVAAGWGMLLVNNDL